MFDGHGDGDDDDGDGDDDNELFDKKKDWRSFLGCLQDDDDNG